MRCGTTNGQDDDRPARCRVPSPVVSCLARPVSSARRRHTETAPAPATSSIAAMPASQALSDPVKASPGRPAVVPVPPLPDAGRLET